MLDLSIYKKISDLFDRINKRHLIHINKFEVSKGFIKGVRKAKDDFRYTYIENYYLEQFKKYNPFEISKVINLIHIDIDQAFLDAFEDIKNLQDYCYNPNDIYIWLNQAEKDLAKAKKEIEICKDHLLDQLYLHMEFCAKDRLIHPTKHPFFLETYFYEKGYLNLLKGNYIDAIDDIKKVLEKELHSQDILLSYAKGCLFAGEYLEAIQTLSKVIQEDPEKKEAYFDRATAYFELGEFDLSLKDYLASEIKSDPIPSLWTETINFSNGITKGILEGSLQGGKEFIPSLVSTLQGLSCELWAFSQDPIQISKDFVEAINDCINYIKTNSLLETTTKIVPELDILIKDWEKLDAVDRGENIGNIIGKYGIEVFASAGVASGVKVYKNLKKANDLLTFEAMALSKANKVAIEIEAAKKAHLRKEMLTSTNLKIQWDKQGKHIPGHKNYNSKMNKSILQYDDPKTLVKKYAGTGLKINNRLPGKAGYQELVNFQKFIGYAVDEITGEKIPTSWGKIHYGKNGVHIVPTKPR